MNTAKIKRIHATMRAAGYERRNFSLRPGIKTYKVTSGSDYWIVYIPGSWSLGVRQRLRNELLEVLKDFAPAPSSWYSGVEIEK